MLLVANSLFSPLKLLQIVVLVNFLTSRVSHVWNAARINDGAQQVGTHKQQFHSYLAVSSLLKHVLCFFRSRVRNIYMIGINLKGGFRRTFD